ncbi:MAG: RidA family protein [Thermomicrobiales bacterium]
MLIEQKLDELGLVLPQAADPSTILRTPFTWVRVRGNRAYIAGHGSRNPDGTAKGPYGKVPSEVSLEDAQAAARLVALSILGSLKRALGDLDRVTAWLMVTGMVNADPGYTQTTNVINGFSDFIIELYGADIGAHARTAVGYATLPLNSAVVIGAEVEIDGLVA